MFVMTKVDKIFFWTFLFFAFVMHAYLVLSTFINN